MTLYILIKHVLKSKLVNEKHSSNSVKTVPVPVSLNVRYMKYITGHYRYILPLYTSTCPCMKVMVVVGPLLVMVILNF
jgi:hypothetical protein